MTEDEISLVAKNIKYMMGEAELGYIVGWDLNLSADYQELRDLPPYQFFRKNKHLKERVCYLTLGGSKAYGTDVPKSGIDLRGVTLFIRKRNTRKTRRFLCSSCVIGEAI